MHVSQDRFTLDQQDRNGIALFEKYCWYNSELCNHCFTRVRAIGDTVEVVMDEHTHKVNKYYERTDDGSQEHCPFDTTKRYGTCFCTNCGADTRPDHRNLPWEQMREFAINLYEYTTEHTPLTLDREAFARELARLKLQRRDTQGKESQMFAVAFARALRSTVHPNHRADATRPTTSAD